MVDTLPIPKVLKQYVLKVDELSTQDEEALQRFQWLCPEDPSEKDYSWDEGFQSDGSDYDVTECDDYKLCLDSEDEED